MIYKDMPVAEAAGYRLAHGHNTPAGKLKKGHTLTSQDIEALQHASIGRVLAWTLEDGDVEEDAAAAQLATAAGSQHIRVGEAFTGRANLFAAADGLLTYDQAQLDALNLTDEAITLAALPPFTPVRQGQMVGTLKIIPFAVTDAQMGTALAQLDGGLMAVRPFELEQVALIETQLGAASSKTSAKLEKITRQRLTPLGTTLTQSLHCDHETEAVAAAIRETKSADLILIAGASATTDRRDVVPAGLVAAGGEIVHFGMPVDPGNLLLLGQLGDTPVIGLPGCARSPKLNGFDWVLERIAAGLTVDAADIMRMGGGGLLKEITSRPQPRAGAIKAGSERFGAVLLGAGLSRRMGTDNKLLMPFQGKPLIAHVAEAIVAAGLPDIVLVTGHQADQVEAALKHLPVRFVANPDYESGMGSSVATGIEALADDLDGAIVALGDMPLLSGDHINQLLSAFDDEEGRAICLPVFEGKRGNPVLFASRFFDEMRALGGDQGARHLLRSHAEEVYEIEMDEAVIADVDTAQTLAELEQKQ